MFDTCCSKYGIWHEKTVFNSIMMWLKGYEFIKRSLQAYQHYKIKSYFLPILEIRTDMHI